MSYRKLRVWQLARDVVMDIHRMSLTLPSFELYEEGSQIRRSVKSIKSNIVEGYGRRKYKGDFIRFLVFAIASCDETIDHLETLFETKSLLDENVFKTISAKLHSLSKQLITFLKAVEEGHT